MGVVKIDQRRKQECLNGKCGLDKSRCLVSYGKSCIKLEGTKIPVQGMPTERRRFPEHTTSFKPYFLSGIPELEGDI